MITAQGQAVDRLAAGETGYLVCAVTPFYGESGGQAGDVGIIVTPTGEATVIGTVKAGPELTAHHITVKTGELLLDQEASLTVDGTVRTATARNHTCTHLLHKALKTVLGSHVNQAGSLVTPERLRFDFSHFTAMKHTPGIAGKLFGTLGRDGINVIACAQGASETNISFVVDSKQLRKSLNVIHDSFFLSEYQVLNLFICGHAIVTIYRSNCKQIRKTQ